MNIKKIFGIRKTDNYINTNTKVEQTPLFETKYIFLGVSEKVLSPVYRVAIQLYNKSFKARLVKQLTAKQTKSESQI